MRWFTKTRPLPLLAVLKKTFCIILFIIIFDVLQKLYKKGIFNLVSFLQLINRAGKKQQGYSYGLDTTDTALIMISSNIIVKEALRQATMRKQGTFARRQTIIGRGGRKKSDVDSSLESDLYSSGGPHEDNSEKGELKKQKTELETPYDSVERKSTLSKEFEFKSAQILKQMTKNDAVVGSVENYTSEKININNNESKAKNAGKNRPKIKNELDKTSMSGGMVHDLNQSLKFNKLQPSATPSPMSLKKFRDNQSPLQVQDDGGGAGHGTGENQRKKQFNFQEQPPANKKSSHQQINNSSPGNNTSPLTIKGRNKTEGQNQRSYKTGKEQHELSYEKVSDHSSQGGVVIGQQLTQSLKHVSRQSKDTTEIINHRSPTLVTNQQSSSTIMRQQTRDQNNAGSALMSQEFQPQLVLPSGKKRSGKQLKAPPTNKLSFGNDPLEGLGGAQRESQEKERRQQLQKQLSRIKSGTFQEDFLDSGRGGVNLGSVSSRESSVERQDSRRSLNKMKGDMHTGLNNELVVRFQLGVKHKDDRSPLQSANFGNSPPNKKSIDKTLNASNILSTGKKLMSFNVPEYGEGGIKRAPSSSQSDTSPVVKNMRQMHGNMINVSKLTMTQSIDRNLNKDLLNHQDEKGHSEFLNKLQDSTEKLPHPIIVAQNDSKEKPHHHSHHHHSHKHSHSHHEVQTHGEMSFTPMDIAYLNRIYHQGKSKKNKEEDLSQDSDTIQNQETYWHKLKRKLKCKSYQEAIQEEELEMDWSEIETPSYTHMQSDGEINVHYANMQEEAKEKHILDLWRRAKGKAVGGAKILKRFAELSDDIAMFGASRRIAVEIEEEIEPLPFILMPDNKLRMAWNLVTMVLLLYTASFVPYRTSFIDQAPPGLEAWEWVVDALFCIDLFINFISAYENSDKNIEVRLKVIAQTYITSWFFFDLAAVFPFQLLEGQNEQDLLAQENQLVTDDISNFTVISNITTFSNKKSSNQNINKLIRLARLPRLYRLLRILRLFKILSLLNNNASFKRLQEAINMNVGIQRMLMIAVSVVFMVHLIACMYFLVGKFEDEDSLYNWAVSAGIGDSPDSYQYIVSVYWALQTLTTVGYGDIPARSVYEKIAAVIWMIIGVGFYSFTIGNLSSIFNSIDVKGAHLQQKLVVLAEFSKRTRLSEDIQNQVKRFLENNHVEHQSLYDQKQLLAEVPANLRAEVVSHTNAEIVQRIKFFNEKDPPFLFAVLPLLKPMKVYPNDQLYSQGDYAEEVFFIFKGRIKMYYDYNHAMNSGQSMLIPFNLYVEGSYFGDSEIFMSDGLNNRDCTAIAQCESQLLVITRKEMMAVFKRFKNLKIEMTEVGVERKKHHERAIAQAVDRHLQKLAEKKASQVSQDSIQTEKSFQNAFEKSVHKPSDHSKSGSLFQTQKFKVMTGALQQLMGSGNHEDQEKKDKAVQEIERNRKLRVRGRANKGNQQEEVFNLLKNFKGAGNKPNLGSLLGQRPDTPSDVFMKSEKITAMNNITTGPLAQMSKSQISPDMNGNPLNPLKSVQTFDREMTLLVGPQGVKGGGHSSANALGSSKRAGDKQGPHEIIEEEELRESGSSSEGDDDTSELDSGSSRSGNSSGTSRSKSSKAPSSRREKGAPNNNLQQTKTLGQRFIDAQRPDEIIHENENEDEESDEDQIEQVKGRGRRMKTLNSIPQTTNDEIEVYDNDNDAEPGTNHHNWVIDYGWNQNEEVFSLFQENMALIAANSFEIYKLYQMIKEDCHKMTARVLKAENNTAQIDNKANELEMQLEAMIKILD